MQEAIKNILINYWEPIVAVLVLILSFILQLIKKRPFKVIDSVSNFIHTEAVNIINRVEIMANGKKYIDFEGYVTSKIDVAIALMKKEIREFFPGIDAEQYVFLIRTIIEDILSTPQKKDKSSKVYQFDD